MDEIRHPPLLFRRESVQIAQDLFFDGSYDHRNASPVPEHRRRTSIVAASTDDTASPAWYDGVMKTTLELLDDLVRALKIRAVEESRRFKDTVADLLRHGLAYKPEMPAGAAAHRVCS
jgi:hypothetical protein